MLKKKMFFMRWILLKIVNNKTYLILYRYLSTNTFERDACWILMDVYKSVVFQFFVRVKLFQP